ncbi:MAG: 6-carboxytetrahydropterin synthase [Desulfobacterota bacterium]|nr:6-carboxytetrahydropterin synthase [Thermodesulfobacteriota bacterium]MDW8001389.1 6-carboxytetrahydropterin synthase [Deltaproteobacteria bacterium]
MYIVSVKDSFSAAHRLSGIAGKCEELHGHNYVVEVFVEGENLKDGLLIDFRELKVALRDILLELDHKYLNELDFFKTNSSSAESVAYYIFSKLEPKVKEKKLRLKEVRVWESENSCASYREDN